MGLRKAGMTWLAMLGMALPGSAQAPRKVVVTPVPGAPAGVLRVLAEPRGFQDDPAPSLKKWTLRIPGQAEIPLRGRAGLFADFDTYRIPAQTVLVVEPDPEHHEALKKALAVWVEQARPEDRIGLVVAGQPEGRWIAPDRPRAELDAALRQLGSRGSGPTMPGLGKALGWLEGLRPTGRRGIFLFASSQGAGPGAAGARKEVAARLASSAIPLHVLMMVGTRDGLGTMARKLSPAGLPSEVSTHLGSTRLRGEAEWSALAEGSGGTFQKAGTVGEGVKPLDLVMEGALKGFKSTPVLDFSLASLPKDGKARAAELVWRVGGTEYRGPVQVATELAPPEKPVKALPWILVGSGVLGFGLLGWMWSRRRAQPSRGFQREEGFQAWNAPEVAEPPPHEPSPVPVPRPAPGPGASRPEAAPVPPRTMVACEVPAPTPGSPAGYLVIQDGPRAGETVAVVASPFLIGAEEGCHLVIPDDAYLSRRHAELVHDPLTRSLLVRDLGTRNGTFLAGRRLEMPTPLAPGDQLRVGHTHLHVKLP